MSTAAIARAPLAALKKGSRSFNFAARALPSSRRVDTAILYAFCRAVDDAADEARSASRARADLTHLRDQLTGQRPAEAVVGALLRVAHRRNIDLQHALELIKGVESDLGPVALLDDRALIRYCYRVAGTVGLMMCGVLGVEDPDALAHALDLGIGMQLTNICRDVAEDAARGRIYLPRLRLDEAGVTQQEVLNRRVINRRALACVVSDLLDKADRYYQSGELGLPYIPARPRLAVLLASRVYREIGEGLRARDCDPMLGRVVISAPQKMLVALRAMGTVAKKGYRQPPAGHDARLHQHLDGLVGARALPQAPRMRSA